MIRKTLLATLVAGALLLGLSGTPAQAQQEAGAKLATCQAQAPSNTLLLNDSYECLGPELVQGSWVATYNGSCFNLNAPIYTDAGHPAPNGWSNAISSFVNNTKHRVRFYDGFNCSTPFNPVWFLGPYSYIDRPQAAWNNKASSIKIECIQMDCQ